MTKANLFAPERDALQAQADALMLVYMDLLFACVGDDALLTRTCSRDATPTLNKLDREIRAIEAKLGKQYVARHGAAR